MLPQMPRVAWRCLLTPAVAAGATCRLAVPAATGKVVLFDNSFGRWSFLTFHLARWSFLSKFLIYGLEAAIREMDELHE